MSEPPIIRPPSSQEPDEAVRTAEDPRPGAGPPGVETPWARGAAGPPKPPGRQPLPQFAPDTAAPARGRWWSRSGRRQWSSCAASFVFHLVLLVTLSLLAQASLPESQLAGLIARTDLSLVPELAGGEDRPQIALPASDQPGIEAVLSAPGFEVPGLPDPGGRPGGPAEPADSQPSPLGAKPIEPADWLLSSDAPVDGALQGRRARGDFVGSGGATAESERAVERGLRWLVAHQLGNGSWDFDHNKSTCRGQCRNPGTEASTTAATAIALLPFLGAGYTHVEGQYQDVVNRGLYHLIRRAVSTRNGVDLQEGTMYAQGLAAIALCEAYALTRDPTLKDLAQGAIRFIVYAQDPRGGGWRYTPGEPGDTTVTGWQLMALKSGQMAGLEVPSPTLFLAQRFLSSVESDGGARYGYMTPEPRDTTTAIGLLLRMYTGWRPNHPGLQKGVAYLGQLGPSEDNMYYNYYATQVMHHWGGAEWDRWNRRIRDYLIATQATASHEAGSWYFSGGYGNVGGRLYNTAMAVMTLEVYYRYMPLYREQAVAGEF